MIILLDYDEFPLSIMIFVTGIAIVSSINGVLVSNEVRDRNESLLSVAGLKSVFVKAFPTALITIAIGFACFYISNFFGFLMFLFVFPVMTYIFSFQFFEKGNVIQNFGNVLDMLKSGYARSLGLFFMLFLISLIYMTFTCSLVVWYGVLYGVQFLIEGEFINTIIHFLLLFTLLLGVNLVIPMFITGSCLLHGTLREKKHANGLLGRIKNFNVKRKSYGVELE